MSDSIDTATAIAFWGATIGIAITKDFPPIIANFAIDIDIPIGVFHLLLLPGQSQKNVVTSFFTK